MTNKIYRRSHESNTIIFLLLVLRKCSRSICIHLLPLVAKANDNQFIYLPFYFLISNVESEKWKDKLINWLSIYLSSFRFPLSNAERGKWKGKLIINLSIYLSSFWEGKLINWLSIYLSISSFGTRIIETLPCGKLKVNGKICANI